MSDRDIHAIDAAESLLRGFNPLANRRGYFFRLAHAIPDNLGPWIANHHQRGKAQVFAALDDFGDTVDRYHLFLQVQRCRVDAFRWPIHELELQSSFPRGIRQGFDPAVILITAAVEHHTLDPLRLGPLRHQLADGFRCRHVAAVGLAALIHRRCRYDGRAFAIVDDLRVNMSHAAEDRETRPLRCTRKLATDPLVNAITDLFLFGSTNHLAPAPVLPTFLRSGSPV